MFNVVLFMPCIPQNTGSIGRLCVNAGCPLHLVRPIGFSLDEKYLRRAGLDYWKHLDLHVYENADEFFMRNIGTEIYFFSTKGSKVFWDCEFNDGAFLAFGNEESGLPADFYDRFKDSMFNIPMAGDHFRSLNLANAVAVALYEGIRRGFDGNSKSQIPKSK